MSLYSFSKPTPGAKLPPPPVDEDKFVLLKPETPSRRSDVKIAPAKVPSLVTLRARPRGRVRRAKGRRPARNEAKRGKAPSLPPTIDSVVTCSHRFRFRASAAQTNTTITYGLLAGTLGVVGTVSNSTVVALASSIKIRRITVYLAETAATDRAEVLWNPSATGQYCKDESKVSTIPDGITVTGPLVFRPPRDSIFAGYVSSAALGGATGTLFNLYCPQGSIIDLDVSWTLSNNIGGTTITGLTTVSVGGIYFLALDGHTNQLAPMGVPTTA